MVFDKYNVNNFSINLNMIKDKINFIIIYNVYDINCIILHHY